MTKSEKENLAAFVIECAKKSGANELAVNIHEEKGVSLQFRDGEIEQLQESQQSGLSIQIYLDNRFSIHSTNDLRKESLEKFIENALKSTKYLSPDPFRQLPDPRFYPDNPDIDLKLIDYGIEQLKTEKRLELVQSIHQAAREQSEKIISVGSSYSDSISSHLKVHSNGFMGYKASSIISAGAETTVKDNSSRPEDWFYANSRFLVNIPSPEFIGKKAALGALNKIGQSKIKTGNYTAIIENRAAIKLISMLLAPMSAAAIQQKSSYMDGMAGQLIASEILTAEDNPFIEGGLGSKLYDADGIKASKRLIIEKGILKTYLIDHYYGKKLGMEPNGASVSNLIFNYGHHSIESMMQNIGRGIFITGFNGGNSNSTTGDFSFGISGYLFENGLITHPINEMNISGNAKSFWKKLLELGNDPYPYSAIQVPSLVFEEIDFSGL